MRRRTSTIAFAWLCLALFALIEPIALRGAVRCEMPGGEVIVEDAFGAAHCRATLDARSLDGPTSGQSLSLAPLSCVDTQVSLSVFSATGCDASSRLDRPTMVVSSVPVPTALRVEMRFERSAAISYSAPRLLRSIVLIV